MRLAPPFRKRLMIEPVALQDFFLTFFSAAMVIVCGALYALLFAYSRVRRRPRLMPLAYFAYLGLVMSVLVLATVANLFATAFWTSIVVLMLVGYLLAPHAIWHLCVGTHAHDHADEEAEALQRSSSISTREGWPCHSITGGLPSPSGARPPSGSRQAPSLH
jgi:hypothetical protein